MSPVHGLSHRQVPDPGQETALALERLAKQLTELAANFEARTRHLPGPLVKIQNWRLGKAREDVLELAARARRPTPPPGPS